MKQVYLHGLGQTAASWDETLLHLGGAEQSVRLHLPELLGDAEPSYANLYEAFARAMDALDGSVDLCGLSLGGMLALHYAVSRPEKVHALTLIAVQYQSPRKLLQFQNLLFRLMPEAMFSATGFSKEAFMRLCASMMALDFTDQLGQIACPVLLIVGEKDRANRRASEELAGLIGQAELRVVPGAGHEVNTDAPQALAGLLHAFYQRL